MSGADENIERSDVECSQVLASMYLFLDKEQLDSDERAHVQQHLDECIPCLESFEFEAELKQVIKKRCTDDMPETLYERVRTSLKAEIRRSGE